MANRTNFYLILLLFFLYIFFSLYLDI